MKPDATGPDPASGDWVVVRTAPGVNERRAVIRIKEAAAGDFPAICALLAEGELNSEDVRDDSGSFLVLRMPGQAGALVGMAGLEVFASANEALLRSVVVAPALRGQQVGARLVGAVEERARRWGIRRLWLLTTTAAAFFRRLGYVDTKRGQALDALQKSSSFAVLCPAEAVCLSKTL